jgi:inward rectifier potassium channel
MAAPPPGFIVHGENRNPLRDLYHRFLKLSFLAAIGLITAVLVAINGVFAAIYLGIGGVANAAPGSFLDAFSFSMQTIATIGYGAMYPAEPLAKVVSDVEALAGLLVTALSTGLLFAKFSQTRGTVVFSRHAVVTPVDGVPTLMFRVGNERGNLIVEAQARVVLTRTEHTKEGQLFYRMYDLTLVRDRSISFTRTWTVLHRITPDSPLYGLDPAGLAAQEIEVQCSVVGIDDTSLQPVHGTRTWLDGEILFGRRLSDLLTPLPGGVLEVDLRKFDDVEPDGFGPAPEEVVER